jgi:hypothetical protein
MTLAKSLAVRVACLSLCAGCLAAVGATRARADDEPMSCKDRIVQIGDSAYDVKSLCGTPDWIETRTESRFVRRVVNAQCPGGSPTSRCATVVEEAVQVPIEEWTYDFGSQRFIEYLTFEQGKLAHARLGNYGHKQT